MTKNFMLLFLLLLPFKAVISAYMHAMTRSIYHTINQGYIAS